MGGVEARGLVRTRRTGGAAQAVVQGVRLAHGAQVAHQGEGIRVADAPGPESATARRGRRRCKSAAQIADLAHRRHPRGQAAGQRGFGVCKAAAQFRSVWPPNSARGTARRVSARGGTAPVRPQVVGPVQRQRVEYQIMRAFLEVEHVTVPDHPQVRQRPLPDLREGRDDGWRRKGSLNQFPPIKKVVSGQFMQEQRRRGAAARRR